MSNYSQIGTLRDTADKLISVKYSVFDAGLDGPDFIDALELRFENDTVATIYVESDFDTLRLELSEMTLDQDCYLLDATLIGPWVEVIESTLPWIWLLTNQQGYEDGFRFEFLKEGNQRIITLLGVASQIEVYVSEKIGLQG